LTYVPAGGKNRHPWNRFLLLRVACGRFYRNGIAHKATIVVCSL
jgi:hypothetical protein